MSQTTEERFSAALHNTARAWRVALDRRLKFLGLGQAGWLTIAMIAKAGQPMSQTELANAVGVECATMVPMLDRLVKDGLVEKQLSPTDRRVKLIDLTPAGIELYAKVRAEADVFRTGLLEGIDGQALADATALLERLREAIERLP
ncbi:MAG: MarR family transcriptional regulator [Burkholderiales bacterium]|nr:MarR family transcriptional regulator [Burkholderiales bacterium]